MKQCPRTSPGPRPPPNGVLPECTAAPRALRRAPGARVGNRSCAVRRSGRTAVAGLAGWPAGGTGRVRTGCRAPVSRRLSWVSAAAAPASAGRSLRAVAPAGPPSAPPSASATPPRSSHRCRDCPCSAARASTPPGRCCARPPLPSSGRFPSACLLSPPSGLRRCAGCSGLHPSAPAEAPVAWTSGAWLLRGSRSVRSPCRSALRAPFQDGAITASADFSPRLAASPFRA